MIGSISHNSVSTNQRRAHQAGFTLIELVMVIVILGILAASAAPKFMSFQADARAASLKALMGSVKSANSMVYGKAMILGTNVNYSEKGETSSVQWKADCTTKNCVEIEGVSVYFKFAYLDRNSVVFALDADIEGRKTVTISSQGKTLVIPDRCGNGNTPKTENGSCDPPEKYSINYKCSSYQPTEVCQDHDYCQCREQKDNKDSQYFIPRGMPYKNGNCYFKYTTAELVTGKVPIYKVETSGC